VKKLKKIDNAGFSLVELLVAVVILGLIVAPLLHTFVTASDTAARSRKMGDATLASQNIAETIEANDLDTIVTGGNTLLGPAAAVDASQAISGSYTISLEGLQAGNSRFNAQVKLDASAAQFAAINAAEIANYSNMDAIFAQSQDAADDPDQNAIAHFVSESSSYTNITTTPSVTRNLKLTVAYMDAEKTKVKADLLYSYTYSFSYKEVNPSGGTQIKSAALSYQFSYSLLPQGFDKSTDAVPNIYLLFNPWYGGTYTDAVLGQTYTKDTLSTSTDADVAISNKYDTFNILNNEDISFNLFLVKQKTAEPLTSAVEMQYSADIILHQSSSASTMVYSNVNESFTTTTGNTKLNNITFKIQYNSWAYLPITDTITGDLVSKSWKNRIYQVTIKIFASGVTDYSGTPLCTFTTTKLQ